MDDVLRLESFFHGSLSVNLERAYKCPQCPSSNLLLSVKEMEQHKKTHKPPPKVPRPPPPITRQQVKNSKKAKKDAGIEDESSADSGEEEQVLYACRICPGGRLFTARERDIHRAFHRRHRLPRQRPRRQVPIRR